MWEAEWMLNGPVSVDNIFPAHTDVILVQIILFIPLWTLYGKERWKNYLFILLESIWETCALDCIQDLGYSLVLHLLS